MKKITNKIRFFFGFTVFIFIFLTNFNLGSVDRISFNHAHAVSPPAISSANVTAIYPSQIDLIWDSGGNAALDGFKYKIWNDESGGDIYVGTAKSFSHTGLLANTAYHYHITACLDSDGTCSGYKDVSATTPTAYFISATPISSSQVNLTWDSKNIPDSFEYKIWNDESGSDIYVGTAKSFSHTGLLANTAYHYHITVCLDSSGVCYGYISNASATTLSACIPSCTSACGGGADGCSGTCPFKPVGTSCNDSNICTNPDQCNGSGSCTGSAITFNDLNTCTNDSCIPAMGCTFTPAQPTCSISATPTLIDMENSSVLNYNEACTTTGLIDNSIGNAPPPSGTKTTGLLSANTTFTLTVNSAAGGTNICNATVAIKPPACTITSSETEVWKGSPLNIKWTSSNATAGTINEIKLAIKSGRTAEGNINTAPITGNINFIMNVTGPGGSGSCGPIVIGLRPPPIGGLIPCERFADNPATGDIDESAPCNICTMFYMLKNIINFAMTMSVGIGAFVFVLIGLLYIFSGGNLERINFAKTAANSVISGISIIFIAWVAIAIILQLLGYGNMSKWNQIDCTLSFISSQKNNLV